MAMVCGAFRELLVTPGYGIRCLLYSRSPCLRKSRNSSTKAGDVIFKPLDGVKVLDLTRVLAGPYCTMIMGDLGAEILKVERPDVGDDTRTWGPPWVTTPQGHKESAYFLAINRNKKSIAVDMKKKEGSKVVQELASKCDILVENYLPGKLGEMGLGYEQLKDSAPHLVYTSITGFGQKGPYSQRGGYDNVAAAVGGLMHITGPEDGEPCRVGVAMTDLSTGLYALSSSLAALIHAQRTGRGQHIDCNLLNTQVATLTHIGSNYLNCDIEARRHGTGHSSIVPYQTFQTKDEQHLMVGAGNEKLFAELCQIIEMEHLIQDDRFSCNEKRVQHRNILIPELKRRFSEKTMSEWLSIFEGSTIPYGPVNSMEQVFKDPQVHYNDMIQRISHPLMGPIRVPGPAVSYSEGELGLQHAPPTLGQHTDSILADYLHYSSQDIDLLKHNQIIQSS